MINNSQERYMLSILYQDADLVAVNKPAGWLVHRSFLDKHETVFVMQTLRDQIGQHVYPVHRLDRPTSGVLLFALSSNVATLMVKQFENSVIEKCYLAIVRGYLAETGTINYALTRIYDKIADEFSTKEPISQSAVSHYRGLATMELPIAVGRYQTARFSLVELKPLTGRKHQLRRHLKHIFHPVIGDSTYGDLHQNRAFFAYFDIKQLMLHAKSLTFTHPKEGQRVTVRAGYDECWQNVLTAFPINLPNS